MNCAPTAAICPGSPKGFAGRSTGAVCSLISRRVESVKNISDGVYRLLSAGYKPILAHAERYESLGFSVEPLKNLRADGALIQMNAGSPLGSFGFMCALRAKAMLKERVADIAASDAHDLSDRPTEMSAGYAFVEKKYGREYAASLFCACPEPIFKNKGE